MPTPLNIKGVTTSLTRHLGGHIDKADKRTYTSQGYGQALKKVLGTSTVADARNIFKTAGVAPHRFDTPDAIKEKDLVNDLHRLSKTGALKGSVQEAMSKIREEQRREHKQMTMAEQDAFRRLAKTTKHELLWGQTSDKTVFSQGAQVAAEHAKQRDIEVRKMELGIEGYGALNQDSDLGKKIKILKDVRHKTEAMTKELEELETQARMINQQAKKDPTLLAKFGLMNIERADDKNVQHMRKLMSPKGLQKHRSDKDFLGEDEKEEDGKNKKKDPSDARPTMNISGGAAASVADLMKTDKPNMTSSLPFTKVGHKFYSADNTSNPSAASKPETQTPKTDESTFGFINDSGDVKADNE